MSIRNQILSRAPQTPTLVPLEKPEWGDVHIKTWSAGERDEYEAAQAARNKAGKGLGNFRANFIIACLVLTAAGMIAREPLFGALALIVIVVAVIFRRPIARMLP